MLPRQEIQQQAIQMQRDIRRKAQEGVFSSQEMLPSLRKLAETYGISHSLAAQTIKGLIEEGIVYTVPRVGIFVGRPKPVGEGVYLLVQFKPETNIHCMAVQVGFEERIAQFGGTSLTMDYETTLDWHSRGQLPKLAGVFEFEEHHLKPRIWKEIELQAPYIEFGEPQLEEKPCDRVYFDNIGGGRVATQHLWSLGHRRIAFLGLHGTHDQPGDFIWSRERAKGWEEAMIKEGCQVEGLLLQPVLTPTIGLREQNSAAVEAATTLIQQLTTGITAVITANHLGAYGLVETLRNANIPANQWPAIVSFDSDTEEQLRTVPLTILRLPWEDIGRSAADLLWARNHEELEETPQEQLVPMRLIKRLTSLMNWGQNAAGMEQHLLTSNLSPTLAERIVTNSNNSRQFSLEN